MKLDRVGLVAGGSRGRLQFADFIPTVVYDSRASDTNPQPTAVSVATDTAAHTKGAWVELIASTSADADLVCFLLAATSASGSANAALFDLGVGGSGSEQVVAANISCGNQLALTASSPLGFIDLPISIPRGSRVAVRWQSGRASATAASAYIALLSFNKRLGIRSPARLETLNADTGASVGTALSLTSNTWTEITTSAPNAYQGFVLTIGSSDAASGTTYEAFDIGIGASGSERATIAPVVYQSTTSESYAMLANYGVSGHFLPSHCPKGARVAVRWRGSSTLSTPTVVVTGVPYA